MPEQNIRLVITEKNVPKELQRLFFPVGKMRLFWEEQPEFMGMHSIFPCDPPFYAIVDMERRKVFAAVTQAYLLITNREAYQFGFAIAKMLFLLNDEDDFKCIHAELSGNRAVCQMDLCRKIDMAQPHINDDWCSFMRIINSYNKTKKLEYVVGFYNVKHGFGFLDNTIAISANTAHYNRFTSYKEDIIKQIKANQYNIDKVEKNFMKKMFALHDITLSKESVLPMFCRVFGIKKTNITDSQKDNLIKTKDYIESKAAYFTNLYGQNAYALLNVFAEYEYQYDSSSLRFLLKSDQFKLGKWVDDLIEESGKEGFSIIKYIGDKASEAAEWLRTLVKPLP